MMYYKLAENELDRSGDYKYMLNLVMDDYQNYFKASLYLQSKYSFCLQSIYSCLSKVNNIDNRTVAYKELSRFLEEVKKRTGLCMKIIREEDKLYVKEKAKIKKLKHYYSI